MLKKLLDSLEIRAGIEVAKPQFPDGRHRPLFHTVKQICKVSVEVVIYLERVRRLAQQHAPGAAEHLHKPAVLQREQAVDNGEDGRFIAHPRYRRFDKSSSPLCAGKPSRKRKKAGANRFLND